MSTIKVYNLPEDLLPRTSSNDAVDLAIFNYEVPNTVMKNKINLNQNVISFLVEGEKEVRFADKAVKIDTTQSLFIADGNFLMTEYIGSCCFKCLLFFFSQKHVSDFLSKHTEHIYLKRQSTSYFQIEKDPFIEDYISSLAQNFKLKKPVSQNILALKLEEILLYLADKYGVPFLSYLESLLISKENISFKATVEKNLYTNLSIEEIAFLCNMSISTFKRQFVSLYNTTPGKWFQKKRLYRAKEILKSNKLKASEIYLDFGYNDLSNFSIAFKKEFGVSPRQVNLL